MIGGQLDSSMARAARTRLRNVRELPALCIVPGASCSKALRAGELPVRRDQAGKVDDNAVQLVTEPREQHAQVRYRCATDLSVHVPRADGCIGRCRRVQQRALLHGTPTRHDDECALAPKDSHFSQVLHRRYCTLDDTRRDAL